METKNRIIYEAPETEVVELKFDGTLCQVICQSVNTKMDGEFVEEDI